MNKKKFTKLLALYLPYLVIGLAATNLGEAWRLAEGKELGDKIVSLMGTLPAAFANPLPSLHPLDILVGIPHSQGAEGEYERPKHILSGAAGCCFQSSVAPVLYITTRLFLITHRR